MKKNDLPYLDKPGSDNPDMKETIIYGNGTTLDEIKKKKKKEKKRRLDE